MSAATLGKQIVPELDLRRLDKHSGGIQSPQKKIAGWTGRAFEKNVHSPGAASSSSQSAAAMFDC